VGGYDLFLRSQSAREKLVPDLVLRVGGSPTSAAVLSYLVESGDALQVVVDEGSRWKDHLAAAHHYLHASPGVVLRRLAAKVDRNPNSGWRALWQEAEARTSRVLDDLGPGELLEGEILAAVVAALPGGSNLMVASSMPIRDLDAFAAPRSEFLRVFGNRGVSGIDGLVSTTIGIACGSGPDPKGEESPEGSAADLQTVGVLGDLAFFHDMNGLLAMKSLEPRVVLVVVNNDGGGIFHTLPVRDHEPAFTRFFATPHGLDFQKAAEMYGIPYARASSVPEFQDRFSKALDLNGPAILEVRTRRKETHERRREVVAEVALAMDGLRPTKDEVG
jgi:2-succinyl-5-enolpyruvyl-6-hydroxy-3-cyclohexene-1-carboxylate synthase